MILSGVLQREWRALLRNRAAVVNPLAFMFIGVMLFAVGSPVVDNARAQFGAAVLWLIVLLTNMLSLDSLFRRDYDSGVLEQVLCGAHSPFIVVLIRVLVQWLSTGLLITMLAPLLCLLLGIPGPVIGVATLALLLGTPAISLIGALGAALTVGFNRGGIILALLVLPLFLPVLIFGTSAINHAIDGIEYQASLYWLAFISMVGLTIGPFAATAGLRISLQVQ